MNTKTFYLNLVLTVLLIGIFSELYLSNSLARNYTQMGLPEGAKARLGKGSIKDLLFSPKADKLAVVSSIDIWLYDTKTYQELTLLPIPKSTSRPLAHRITSTSFSADGETILSVTDEKLMLIWNVATEEHKVISMHNNVSYSERGQTLTIESENETVEWKNNCKVVSIKNDNPFTAFFLKSSQILHFMQPFPS